MQCQMALKSPASHNLKLLVELYGSDPNNVVGYVPIHNEKNTKTNVGFE